MTPPSPESSANDRLGLILAAFLEAVARGESPDRDAILAANPDLADDLRSFFADHDAMAKIAAPLRENATDTAPFHAPTGLHASSNPAPIIAGTRLQYVGDYELLGEIASGGMGVVYLARQMTLNRPVAVKMILAGTLADAEAVRRFRHEAEAAAALDHPHIVPIHEVGEHDGRPYFSMKLIDGPSLADVLARSPRPSRRELVAMLATVARAVDHAHRRGVLHRDLQPRNILVDAAGQPHVTDFGLARRLEAASDLTGTGGTPGTPSYMAPEQARGLRRPRTAVDVYGLGAILYEILTGRPPHRAETPVATLRLVLDTEPVPPRTLDPTIDRDLETIAMKALEKDPRRRYESAAEMASELDRWMRKEPIRARPVSRTEKTYRWCRRNPVVAGLVGAVATSLMIGGLTSAFFAFRAAERAREAIHAKGATERTFARSLVRPLGLEINAGLTEPEEQALHELADLPDDSLAPLP